MPLPKCWYCHTEFTPTHNTRRYCNDDCRDKAKEERLAKIYKEGREKRAALRKINLVPIPCKKCKVDFTPTRKGNTICPVCRNLKVEVDAALRKNPIDPYFLVRGNISDAPFAFRG